MSLRLSICVFYLLLSSAAMPAQDSSANAKQQAKDLADKARGEGSDRAKQVQDYCAAAQLQPKEKKYVDACNSYREGLINDDQAWLASAIALYKSHDLDKAESTAKLVTSYDQKLSGQARFLLDLIKNERLLNQVKAAWAKGDFTPSSHRRRPSPARIPKQPLLCLSTMSPSTTDTSIRPRSWRRPIPRELSPS